MGGGLELASITDRMRQLGIEGAAFDLPCSRPNFDVIDSALENVKFDRSCRPHAVPICHHPAARHHLVSEYH